MITAEEVVRSLPELLKQQPEFRTKIYEILSDEFVKRTEFYEYMTKSDERFERLLQELKAFREDTNRRFEAMDRRFEAMDRRFEAMRKDMNSRFEEVNKRFEAVDRRFEAVDRRFEEVEKRFEEVYRRFDKIDTESMIFEIKSYAEEEDVERFNDKAELAMKKLGLKKPKKALITLDKHPLNTPQS